MFLESCQVYGEFCFASLNLDTKPELHMWPVMFKISIVIARIDDSRDFCDTWLTFLQLKQVAFGSSKQIEQKRLCSLLARSDLLI